ASSVWNIVLGGSYAWSDFWPRMADLAAAIATLRDALPLPGGPMGVDLDGLANGRWLGADRHAWRPRAFRHPGFPNAGLRAALAAAFFFRPVGGQHDCPGKGPAHLRAAAPDGPAQLRNRAGKASGQPLADRPVPGGLCSRSGL